MNLILAKLRVGSNKSLHYNPIRRTFPGLRPFHLARFSSTHIHLVLWVQTGLSFAACSEADAGTGCLRLHSAMLSACLALEFGFPGSGSFDRIGLCGRAVALLNSARRSRPWLSWLNSVSGLGDVATLASFPTVWLPLVAVDLVMVGKCPLGWIAARASDEVD